MSEIPGIGDVVREWRGYRQISLTEFSKRTKLTKGYISELEHNKIDNPKTDKLERMAEPLGISVLDILSRRMPDEVKDGNVAGNEEDQATALVDVPEEGAPGGKQPALGQPNPKASPHSAVYHSPLSTRHQNILMHRLAGLKKKVEAAENNLRHMREELLEIEALAVDMFGEEESHAPTPATGNI
jgi:transcriptional regulator with XRE-family HTH domain